jgi:hypothetical protein
MDALALIALAGSGLALALERYRPTQHGHNPWSIDALVNVLRLAPHFETARDLVDGKFTSVYRSERVNKIVGGVINSDHLWGGAIDLKPHPHVAIETAAKRIYEAAERGELGPVRQVVLEPTWVHVGWYRPGRAGRPQVVQR